MTNMPTHNANTPEPLARRAQRLLERQRDALQRVAALARGQRALIDSEETDSLLGLMAQRQTALQEAAGAGEELAALRAAGGFGGTPDIERLHAEIDALATEIGERDEADRQALERRRERVLSEMSGLARAREAAAAYGTRDSAARFQDREG